MENETYFASPDRVPKQAILPYRKSFEGMDMVIAFLEASNSLFMILNETRQVIYANSDLLNYIRVDNDKIIGQRPGEMLHCVNAQEAPSGCGTHWFCRECGAIDAILSAQQGTTKKNECRINARNGNKHFALDIAVKASPFEFDNAKFVLFAVKDISDAKRRQVLERTFFHDILNTAGGVYGFSELLKEDLAEEQSEHAETAQSIHDLSTRLINEIKNQRQLLAAERSELEIEITKINLPECLQSLVKLFERIIERKNLSLEISHCQDYDVFTDKTLLDRVLINMIKNAIEASGENGKVRIEAYNTDNSVVFSVHNDTYIEESVQHQIFQRSFSTKGKDRGIGTYSMKLFGEDYLRGKVWFESSQQAGTTFYLKIPKWLEH